MGHAHEEEGSQTSSVWHWEVGQSMLCGISWYRSVLMRFDCSCQTLNCWAIARKKPVPICLRVHSNAVDREGEFAFAHSSSTLCPDALRRPTHACTVSSISHGYGHRGNKAVGSCLGLRVRDGERVALWGMQRCVQTRTAHVRDSYHSHTHALTHALNRHHPPIKIPVPLYGGLRASVQHLQHA